MGKGSTVIVSLRLDLGQEVTNLIKGKPRRGRIGETNINVTYLQSLYRVKCRCINRICFLPFFFFLFGSGC